MQSQDRKEIKILEVELSKKLIDLWDKDFDFVKQYEIIEELERSIKSEDLREVVLDALFIM